MNHKSGPLKMLRPSSLSVFWLLFYCHIVQYVRHWTLIMGHERMNKSFKGWEVEGMNCARWNFVPLRVYSKSL